MANINPPMDRNETWNTPTYVYRDQAAGMEIRMGPEKEGPSGTSDFRYVIVSSGASQGIWQGYLYKEPQ